MSDQKCQKRRRSDMRMALVKEAPEGEWKPQLVAADHLPRGEEYGSITDQLIKLLEPVLDFAEKAERTTAQPRFTTILLQARILFGEVRTTRAWAEALRRKGQI